MSKKLFIIPILAIIILSVVGYFYYKEQIFSKSILKLEILGPDDTSVGQEVEYTVRYKNNSDFTLEEPNLIFEFPEYTVTEDGKTRITKTLDDIYPGDEQFVQFKGRLLGKQDDLKVAKAQLSYKPKNLKARYGSDTTFTTKISAVPITLDFDLPSKVETGKEIQFSVNYSSAVDYTLSGLKLQVIYPNGFDFLKSTPKAIDSTAWELEDLEKDKTGNVTITGNLGTDPGNTVQFQAKLGIWQSGQFIILREVTKDVEVTEPQIFISQKINGTDGYIASPGETLHYEIYFRNIGDTPLQDIYLIDKLDSPIYDLSTIRMNTFQGRVSGSTIIWDSSSVPSLGYLAVQQSGKVEFDVTLKSNWQPSGSTTNSTIIINRVEVSQTNQKFETKVNSKLAITQKGFYQDGGIFGNTGSIPPMVDQATTYTITWQIKNFYDDVQNIKVRATLPEGVSYTNNVSPGGDGFSFDINSKEVVWNAGSLSGGLGVSNTTKSISFQISLTPNASQKGRVLTLIGPAAVTAQDQWTGQEIQAEDLLVNTTLPDDDEITSHSGIIQ